jgi:hypothetical protein
MKKYDKGAEKMFSLYKNFGIKITMKSGFRYRWISSIITLPHGPGPLKKYYPFGYFLYMN